MGKELNFDVEYLTEYTPATEINGYNSEEIDSVLDRIIDDYNFFNEKIRQLQVKLKMTEKEVEELKNQKEELSLQVKEINNKAEQEIWKFKTDSNLFKRMDGIEDQVNKMTEGMQEILSHLKEK